MKRNTLRADSRHRSRGGERTSCAHAARRAGRTSALKFLLSLPAKRPGWYACSAPEKSDKYLATTDAMVSYSTGYLTTNRLCVMWIHNNWKKAMAASSRITKNDWRGARPYQGLPGGHQDDNCLLG